MNNDQPNLWDSPDEQDAYDDEIDAQEGVEDNAVTAEQFQGIVIAPSDWTVGTIYSQLGKQINLDPAFQRRNVWSPKAKSRFIESLLLGVPVPQILLSAYIGQKNSFLVLDGKQRLSTIREFIGGSYLAGGKFKLSELKVLKGLNGKTWQELEADPEWRDKLLNETLRTSVMRGWKDEAVLYQIFYRLNSGSVKLSPMELRMSLHPGEFLRQVIAWTEVVGPLHKLLRKARPDPRMADVELAVRYMAFQSGRPYQGNLKDFLDKVCIEYNAFMQGGENADFANFALAELNEVIASGFAIFGENFCKKYLGDRYETRFNRAIFDILAGSLTNMEFRPWALNNIDTVTEAYNSMFKDAAFVKSVESTTKTPGATLKRFSTWYHKIEGISGIKIKLPIITIPE